MNITRELELYHTFLTKDELETIMTRTFSMIYTDVILKYSTEYFIDDVYTSCGLSSTEDADCSIPLVVVYIMADVKFSNTTSLGLYFKKAVLDVLSIDLTKYNIDMDSKSFREKEIDKDDLYDFLQRIGSRIFPVLAIKEKVSFFMKCVCRQEGISRYTKKGTISIQTVIETAYTKVAFDSMGAYDVFMVNLILLNRDLCIQYCEN